VYEHDMVQKTARLFISKIFFCTPELRPFMFEPLLSGPSAYFVVSPNSYECTEESKKSTEKNQSINFILFNCFKL